MRASAGCASSCLTSNSISIVAVTFAVDMFTLLEPFDRRASGNHHHEDGVAATMILRFR
jgi:hypothetical protein